MKVFVKPSEFGAFKNIKLTKPRNADYGSPLTVVDIQSHWFSGPVVLLDESGLRELLARVAAGHITKEPEKIMAEYFGDNKGDTQTK